MEWLCYGVAAYGYDSQLRKLRFTVLYRCHSRRESAFGVLYRTECLHYKRELLKLFL